jgi:hypothetical protein
MKRGTLALFLIVFSPAAMSSAQGVKPLLQLHSSVTYPIHGAQYADRNLFVASDGTATSQVVAGDPVSGLGWSLSSKTARASAAQLAALQTALGQAQIGQQAGGCAIRSRLPADGVAELTWYGRGLRRNALSVTVVSTTGGGDACPPELQALFQAIDDFSAAVLGQ